MSATNMPEKKRPVENPEGFHWRYDECCLCRMRAVVRVTDPGQAAVQRPNDSDEEEIQRPDGQNSNGENADETESETSMIEDRLNQEQIILNASDVDDIETYVTGITGATISYSTRSSVEGR